MALSGTFQNYPVSSFGLYCEWSGVQSVTGNYTSPSRTAPRPTCLWRGASGLRELPKLSSSISSSSTTLAANSYAVKRAYDRSSWTSISLTNALAIAYGGTGAKNAAAARTNLGIAATSLYNGTLTSGSITFNYGNYNFYVIIGRPSSTASRASLVVPKIMLTTSAVSFQIADESNYKSFNLSYSGSLVTLAIQGGNGQINRVFGIN